MNDSGQFKAGFLSKSDCMVQYEPSLEALSIEVHSSVQALFERQIRQCALKTLEEFGVTTGRIVIDDDGALDLVISARIEAVLRQMGYIPQERTANLQVRDRAVLSDTTSGFSRVRSSKRVRLYMPGDQPHFAVNADSYGADILIFDLEDSVAQSKKSEARILVRRFLENAFLFKRSARAVRINPLSTEEAMLDLAEIVSAKPDIILLPKCETADEVKRLDALLCANEDKHGIQLGTVQIMPIIETAKGVLSAAAIASASKRNSGLCFGYEDFSRDIQSRVDVPESATRADAGPDSCSHKDSKQLGGNFVHQIDALLAREMIVLAARASGIEPFDSSYSDLENTDGLLASCYEAKALGFAGKSVVHPSQIPYVKRAFMPTAEELNRARSIVSSYEESVKAGKGAVAIDGQMVDMPVVEKARHIIEEGAYGE